MVQLMGVVMKDHRVGPILFRKLMASIAHPVYYNDLDAILEKAWSVLMEGVCRANSPYHIINVATVGRNLMPRVRSVVLRGFDETSRTIRFHTDARSEKVSEIMKAESLAVHLYSNNQKIQLRMLCRGTVHHCDDVSSDAWHSMKDMSRACYSQLKAPGSVVGSPDSVQFSSCSAQDVAYSNFAAVLAKIETLEWLYLSATGHRRARFDWRNDDPTGTWLAP